MRRTFPTTTLLRRRGAIVAVAVTTALTVSACGGNGADEQADGSTGAPPAELATGAAVYAASCASCHGTDLRGTERGPSHLSKVYEPSHHGDDAFRRAIAQGSPQHHWGFGDMPPVSDLSPDEVSAVIAYIRDVQSREGFEPYPPR